VGAPLVILPAVDIHKNPRVVHLYFDDPLRVFSEERPAPNIALEFHYLGKHRPIQQDRVAANTLVQREYDLRPRPPILLNEPVKRRCPDKRLVSEHNKSCLDLRTQRAEPGPQRTRHPRFVFRIHHDPQRPRNLSRKLLPNRLRRCAQHNHQLIHAGRADMGHRLPQHCTLAQPQQLLRFTHACRLSGRQNHRSNSRITLASHIKPFQCTLGLMKAIQIQQTGGPDVLNYTDVPVPTPKAGEVLVKVAASGVNFIDIYYREGRYKTDLPFIVGQEGGGTVESVGPGVTGFAPGDRVAWCMILGSYADYAIVPVDQLVPVPAHLDLKLAAAVILQGMTAHYLVRSTFPLKSGDTALVHAAAGGTGLLLTQMASQIGARVIATVSTEEKAALARQAGATEIIFYTQADFESETKRLTGNRGVDVVYDSVGKTTFEKSLNTLRPRGMMVLFGGASGAVPPFDLIELSTKGSLYVTRPTLKHYTLTRDELLARAADVLKAVDSGKLKVRMEHTYPLRDARQAQLDLAGRKTTGKLLLIP